MTKHILASLQKVADILDTEGAHDAASKLDKVLAQLIISLANEEDGPPIELGPDEFESMPFQTVAERNSVIFKAVSMMPYLLKAIAIGAWNGTISTYGPGKVNLSIMALDNQPHKISVLAKPIAPGFDDVNSIHTIVHLDPEMSTEENAIMLAQKTMAVVSKMTKILNDF